MNFISRWFSKSPSDLLSKGDRHMESDSFFDARTCYEDGLRLCSGENAGDDMSTIFSLRIDEANRKLAERNLHEAEFAHSHGDSAKAIDHLELVKSLTNDQTLREKADQLLLIYSQTESNPVEQNDASSSCSSCAGSSCGGSAHDAQADDSQHAEHSLTQHEYYELLIHQLPPDQYERYAPLNDEFVDAYIAASQDHHNEALAGLETCRESLPQDIYWYEKGKVLHRLGRDREAEQHLGYAVKLNRANAFAWLNLSYVLCTNGRFQEALNAIETMVTENILPEQAQLLRGDIFEAAGNHEDAVNQFVELLQTPYSRTAAEKLYPLLMGMGRNNDAAVIFKKYLNKSCC